MGRQKGVGGGGRMEHRQADGNGKARGRGKEGVGGRMEHRQAGGSGKARV